MDQIDVFATTQLALIFSSLSNTVFDAASQNSAGSALVVSAMRTAPHPPKPKSELCSTRISYTHPHASPRAPIFARAAPTPFQLPQSGPPCNYPARPAGEPCGALTPRHTTCLLLWPHPSRRLHPAYYSTYHHHHHHHHHHLRDCNAANVPATLLLAHKLTVVRARSDP